MAMINDLMELLSQDTVTYSKYIMRTTSSEGAMILAILHEMDKVGESVMESELKLKVLLDINLGEKAFGNHLEKLKQAGYVESVKLRPQEISSFLMKKDIKGLGIGNFLCPWCNSKTLIPHEHHYPIPKHLGGTETVRVCPTCHFEYHFLYKSNFVKAVV